MPGVSVRLLLLNGPPGIGKTTLARRYAADHPLALCLDVDTVRGLLGGWRDEPSNAGEAARALALAMARTHLAAGHDVVVPQLVARPAFLDALRALADETGATFTHVVLTDDRDAALRRFATRGGDATHDEAAALYDRLHALLASRPEAVVLTTRAGEEDAAYAALLAALTA